MANGWRFILTKHKKGNLSRGRIQNRSTRKTTTMQNMFGSLLILSSVASLGHAARFSLLRIADDTNGSSNVNKATEFRSIFEEGLNGYVRERATLIVNT